MSESLHIRILMGTLNGAQYLDEQLRSISAQTHQNWSLWISDDGSEDSTLDTLEAFRKQHPQHDIQIFQGPHEGATANYLSLIARVPTDLDGVIALSDQDDVWMPEKLKCALQATNWQAAQPIAYGAAQIFTDENLNHQKKSLPCPSGPSFANALVQNILSGSTLVFNLPALCLIQNSIPQATVPFHDWWIYQIVTGAGGATIYDPTPTVLYRQHPGNLLGGNRGISAVRRRFQILNDNYFSTWLDQNNTALMAANRNLLSENLNLLTAFNKARNVSWLKRPTALRQIGIHRQTSKGTIALLSAAIFGRV